MVVNLVEGLRRKGSLLGILGIHEEILFHGIFCRNWKRDHKEWKWIFFFFLETDFLIYLCEIQIRKVSIKEKYWLWCLPDNRISGSQFHRFTNLYFFTGKLSHVPGSLLHTKLGVFSYLEILLLGAKMFVHKKNVASNIK